MLENRIHNCIITSTCSSSIWIYSHFYLMAVVFHALLLLKCVNPSACIFVIPVLQDSHLLSAILQFKHLSTTASCSHHSVIFLSTHLFVSPATLPGDDRLPSAPSLCLQAPSSAGVWQNSCPLQCPHHCPPSHRYCHNFIMSRIMLDAERAFLMHPYCQNATCHVTDDIINVFLQ